MARYIFPIVVIITYLGTVSLLVIFKMDYFYIKEIRITGTKNINPNEILRRTGLKAGYSTIFFSTSKAKAKILENPRITTVSFKKDFPSKLVIEVEELTPFCLFRDGAKGLYYLSENGVNLGRANHLEGLDFPSIVSEDIKKPELVTSAIQILKLSRASNVLKWNEISEIQIDPVFGIRVLTSDKRQIDFGEANIQAKWRKVEQIIAHSRSINLVEKYINIGSEDTGVVSYKNLQTH